MQIRTNPIALSIVFITFFMILFFFFYKLFTSSLYAVSLAARCFSLFSSSSHQSHISESLQGTDVPIPVNIYSP